MKPFSITIIVTMLIICYSGINWALQGADSVIETMQKQAIAHNYAYYHETTGEFT